MSDTAKNSRNYEVGRGKPPKATRFKPGQSGNPSGRPKKRKDFRTAIKDELKRLITVHRDGKPMRIPHYVAFAAIAVREATKFNPKALAIVLPVMAELTAELATYKEITRDMSVQEAAAAWAETLKGAYRP